MKNSDPFTINLSKYYTSISNTHGIIFHLKNGDEIRRKHTVISFKPENVDMFFFTKH